MINIKTRIKTNYTCPVAFMIINEIKCNDEMISYTRKLALLLFVQEGGYVNSRVCTTIQISILLCHRSRIHTYLVTMQSIYINGINIEGHINMSHLISLLPTLYRLFIMRKVIIYTGFVRNNLQFRKYVFFMQYNTEICMIYRSEMPRENGALTIQWIKQ